MARLQLFDADGALTAHSDHAPDVQRMLRDEGIEAGHWSLREAPLSATPMLTYARELCALQCRFGTVRTDHARLRPAPVRRLARRTDWRDLPDEHVHDDVELRVVLQGRLLYSFSAPGRSGWAALLLEPGDWLALPSDVPHVVDAGPLPQVDLLRLFGAGSGWVARRAGTARPATLPCFDALVRPSARALAA